MIFKFFQRKDTGISAKELEWINENLYEIAKTENVLFVYQADYESILITNKHIYFPNRETLIRLSFSKIEKIKVAKDVLLKVITDEKITYCIILTDAVSKVKLFEVLNLLKKNYLNNKETKFEEIKAIFDKFSIVKYPYEQEQHKLPQVYLKQFGYKREQQWMVSVLDKNEDFTRQKSIKSFTATTNIFDINSQNDKIVRIFEDLNCELENEYWGIIDDIESNDYISEKSRAYLLQIISNFMVRSDYWRGFIKDILESERKEDFLKITLSFITPVKNFNEHESKDYYKLVATGDIDDDKINRALMYFMGYLFRATKNFQVVIFEAPNEKLWFTSDNPVVFNSNREEGLGICGPNSEFYLPLSKKYLAYFYFKKSGLDEPIFRTLENKKIYKILDIISEEEHEKFVREVILNNKSQMIIFPSEIKHKREKTVTNKA